MYAPSMPLRWATFTKSLGANHSDATHRRNSSSACCRVTTNGSSDLGLICFLLAAVATIAAPQNGHLLAATSWVKSVSAPQAVHRTVSVSCVCAALPGLDANSWKSSSSITAASGAISFSVPQYGHFKHVVPGSNTRFAPHWRQG